MPALLTARQICYRVRSGALLELDRLPIDIIVNLLYHGSVFWTILRHLCCGRSFGWEAQRETCKRSNQKLLGDELQLMQFGGMPKDAKPFKGVGRGVLEIALQLRHERLPGDIGHATWRENLRVACLAEEIQEGDCDR